MEEKNNLHLEKVSITGFRTIQNLKVKLHPDLNIIIGKNGTGKTNFCEALYEALTFNAEEYLGFESDFIILNKKEEGVKYKVQNKLNKQIPHDRTFSFNTQQVYGYYTNQKKQDLNVLNKFHVFINSTNSSFNPILIKHGIPFHYYLVNQSVNFSIDRTTFTSSGLLSIIKKQHYPVFIKKLLLKFLDTDVYRDFNLKNSIANLKKEAYSIKPFLTRYSNIQDFKLVEPITTHVDEIKNENHIQGLSLEFKINDQWLPFKCLSSGTQRMFYIISEVAINGSMSFSKRMIYPNKDNNKIIILEEPELGLHPHQLNKLLQFIKEFSKQHQFIITTHSPQVLDMLEPDEVNRILIARIEDGKTRLKKLKAAEIRKAQKYMKEELFLSDYWKYSDLEKEEDA